MTNDKKDLGEKMGVDLNNLPEKTIFFSEIKEKAKDESSSYGYSSNKAGSVVVKECFATDDEPIGNINVKLRKDGVKLELLKIRGYGTETYRAIRSGSFSAEKFREKYLELAEEFYQMKEKAEKRKKREKRKKNQKEKVERALVSASKDLGLEVREYSNIESKVREFGFGPDDVRLKAEPSSDGIDMELENLTEEQYRKVVEALS